MKKKFKEIFQSLEKKQVNMQKKSLLALMI